MPLTPAELDAGPKPSFAWKVLAFQLIATFAYVIAILAARYLDADLLRNWFGAANARTCLLGAYLPIVRRLCAAAAADPNSLDQALVANVVGMSWIGNLALGSVMVFFVGSLTADEARKIRTQQLFPKYSYLQFRFAFQVVFVAFGGCTVLDLFPLKSAHLFDVSGLSMTCLFAPFFPFALVDIASLVSAMRQTAAYRATRLKQIR